MFGDGNKDETRNLILAAVLSMGVVFAWYALFPPPEPPREPLTAEGQAGSDGEGVVASGTGAGAAGPAQALDRNAALERFERVQIVSDALTGSIALTGGRLDDLHLEYYRETLEPGSDTVVLLNPTAGPNPYYAVYGWLPTQGGNPGELPGANTAWELAEGDELTPDSPVTLEWTNEAGLTFRRTYTLDDRYMVTLSQSVENTSDVPVSLAPYGYLARRGEPETTPFFILHEGVVAMIDGTLTELSYGDLEELAPDPQEGGLTERVAVNENGWLGFTDKYWMTTLIPPAGQPFTAVYKAIPSTSAIEYRTEMRLPVTTIEPGSTETVETRLFAGAKELNTISDYGDALGIVNFVDSIDWGWFYFLTKPIAWALNFINGIIGNMGWSIIVLTLVIKTVLFPLAYKSYVAMGRMKKLQPEMEKLKERAGDDRMKLQQEMMALYKKEKVNPAAGCLPILVQIPIFFALYKVLFVTIEMRHAPFMLWIDDLSAPDPTSWLNLFGILPYDVSWAPEIISIGVFPVLMGVTMWMQQRLNPAPTDPTQQMIFAWMPWMFMFMLGSFASGLVIYWTANNVLTFAQQYAIMRSQGVEVDFFGNVKASIKRLVKKEPPPEEKPAAKPDAEFVDDDVALPSIDDAATAEDGEAGAEKDDGAARDDGGSGNERRSGNRRGSGGGKARNRRRR
ncbi:MAG: membrane protein insertase YidC [Pseudomonadota bacterium]